MAAIACIQLPSASSGKAACAQLIHKHALLPCMNT
jgi:hypothetical protein